MFFTDSGSHGAPASDITQIEVPPYERGRTSNNWLDHRNMAALTPVWTYMLQHGTVDGYDWAINVELDHLTRPSKVRKAIAQIITRLGHGSPWERSFVDGQGQVSTNTAKPMMLAFGNAYLFNQGMMGMMKRQWHLIEPELTADNGCPFWSHKHCEQDMVYPRMLGFFKPPIQMFGSSACGRVAATADGKPLPLTCWDFFMNPYRPVKSASGKTYQMNLTQQEMALKDIAQGKGCEPKLALVEESPTVHVTADMVNVSDEWPSTQELLARAPSEKWDRFLPPKDIPILHHMYSSKAHMAGRTLLGL